jgi:hypothetical protein
MRGAPVHEQPQPICELREPRAPGAADDPIPQRPRLHKGHLARRARAQVLKPAGPGRRVGIDKVLHAILQVLRRHNAQVPRAAAASGLAEDLATEGPEVNAAEARASFMSVCSEVRKRVPPTSMRIGTSSGCSMAMLHLPIPLHVSKSNLGMQSSCTISASSWLSTSTTLDFPFRMASFSGVSRSVSTLTQWRLAIRVDFDSVACGVSGVCDDRWILFTERQSVSTLTSSRKNGERHKQQGDNRREIDTSSDEEARPVEAQAAAGGAHVDRCW